MNSNSLLVLLLVLACSLVLVQAGKIKYQEKQLFPQEEIPLRMGIITQEDSWRGKGDVYIHINETFEQETKQPGWIEVLVYYYQRAVDIGFHDPEGFYHPCCTASLKEKYDDLQCEDGRVINNDPDHIKSFVVEFDGQKKSSPLVAKYLPQKSGIYYVTFYNCQENHAGTVVINGEVVWHNPFGYLSVDLYPYLWFFAFLSVLYLVLGLAWLVMSIIHRKQLLMLQNCIAGVIVLGLVECVTWYFDFLLYNSTGNFNWGAITIGIFSSTVKRTVSRLLVLVVSMGYGVVKADLGTTRYKVLLLGSLYFIVSGTAQLVETALREGDDGQFLLFLSTILIFPGALLDTVFYWWIFLSLMRTIQQLQVRKNPLKLIMYKRFFVVLAVSGVITIVVILYQFLIILTSSIDEHWRTWWVFNACWHVLYYAVLVAIVIIWRPTENNTRYAYVENEESEIAMQTLAKGDYRNDDVDISDVGTIDLQLELPTFEGQDEIDEISKMQ